MAYRSFLLTAALLLAFMPAAHAGYAMAKPPPGWATGPNGTPLFKPVGPMPTTAANGTMNAANGMSYGPGGARGTTTVPAGTDVPVSYAFKYAATAGAAAASMLATNPAILLAAMAVPHLLDWMNQDTPNKYDIRNGKVYETNPNDSSACMSEIVTQGCFMPGQIAELYPSAGYCVTGSGGDCPPGTSYYVVRGRVQNPQAPADIYISPGDFPTTFGGKPITPGLPWVLPNPLPVDVPVINPTPAPVEQPWPSPAPQPQPIKVPLSDPAPVPNTDPQIYRQPWTEIVPSPTPLAPWRVNMRPSETTSTDPTPAPGPVVEPVPAPGTPAGTPSTAPENPDFCALHPDAIACLPKGDPGTLEPVPLYNQDKDVSQIQKTGTYGPAGATCPTGQTLHIGSTPIELGYGSLCEFATMINPLVIGFAWLSAAFTFFGFARKD